jgi:hypothetical protein
MMQVGTNQSTTYHSQPTLSTPGGQTGRPSSTSRQQQSQYDTEQLANIRTRLCTLRKWPHYDGKKTNFDEIIILLFYFQVMVFI